MSETKKKEEKKEKANQQQQKKRKNQRPRARYTHRELFFERAFERIITNKKKDKVEILIPTHEEIEFIKITIKDNIISLTFNDNDENLYEERVSLPPFLIQANYNTSSGLIQSLSILMPLSK